MLVNYVSRNFYISNEKILEKIYAKHEDSQALNEAYNKVKNNV